MLLQHMPRLLLFKYPFLIETDLLSQSIRSFHHQFVTIDGTKSQIIQYDTYSRQT